jgi:hypothetical protein
MASNFQIVSLAPIETTALYYDVITSQDGRIVVVANYATSIFVSTDYGNSWYQSNQGGNFIRCCMSYDGTYIYTAIQSNGLWRSTDFGRSFTQVTTTYLHNSKATCTSRIGDRVAVAGQTNIWTSSNYGATWTERTGSGSRDWFSLSMSENGDKIVAAPNNGFIYTSSDFGVTWTERQSPGSRTWRYTDCNGDGSRIIATANTDSVYISNDSGASWSAVLIETGKTFYACSISYSGNKMAVYGSNTYVWTSSNSGSTWSQQLNTTPITNVAASICMNKNTVLANDGIYMYSCLWANYIYRYESNYNQIKLTAYNSRFTGFCTNSTGQYMGAVIPGIIYISNNYGISWTPIIIGGSWTAITVNSTGQYFYAVMTNGFIHKSSNYGVSFEQSSTQANNFAFDVACSSDGSIVYVATGVGNGSFTFRSTDFAVTFTALATLKFWRGVCCSTNGNTAAAIALGVGGGGTSLNNTGVYTYVSGTWTERTSSGGRAWTDVTCNSTCSIIYACANNDYIYRSTDTGSTWTTLTSAGIKQWVGVSCSSDGTVVYASAQNDFMYVSTNSGTNWSSTYTAGGTEYWTKPSKPINSGYVLVSYPGYSNGLNTYSLAFNRASSQRGTASGYHIQTGTAECWVRSTGGFQWGGIIGKQGGYIIYSHNSYITIYQFNNGATFTTSALLNDNLWHHVALVFQNNVSNGSKVYFDGSPILTFTYGVGTGGTLNVGYGGAGSEFFNGNIDEVRIWNTVRTDAQISDNYNKLIDSASTGLVAYWSFTEGTGTSVTNQVSGQPALTLINSPTWTSSTPSLSSTIVPNSLTDEAPPPPIIGASIALNSFIINPSSSSISNLTFNGNLSSSTPGNTLVGNVTTLNNFSITQLRLIGNSVSTIATVVSDTNSTQTTAQRSYIAAIAEDGFTKFSRLFTYIGRSNILYGYQTNQRYISGNITMDESNINSSYTSGNAASAGTVIGGETTYSILLNGTNQDGRLSNALYYAYNTGTVEAWIRIPVSGAGSSYRGIITKPFAYGLFLLDNILVSYDWGASPSGEPRTTSIALNDNTWHHVALSFNSGVTNGSKIYIDGVLRLTTTITVSSQGTAMYLGNNSAPQYMNGFISNVRIWDVVLTDAYIASNYNKALPVNTPNLKGYWKINENTGTTLTNLITNHGYNFTLSNAPTWSSSAPSITSSSTFAFGSFTTATTIMPSTTNNTAIGIFAPNRDKIYCPIYSATAGRIFIIDCSTNTISNVTIPGTNPFIRHAVFAPNNNRLFFVDGTNSRCFVFNTNTETLVGNVAINNSGSLGYEHGAYVSHNQCIYMVPRSNTYTAIINTNTNAISYITGFPGSNAYIGCVYSPPHRKIYCVPFGRSSVGVINTDTNTFTIDAIAAASSYHYGALGSNGKIYCFPWVQTNMLVIDPSLNTATQVSTLNIGSQVTISGAIHPFDGKLYCVRLNGTGNLIVIDTSTNTFTLTSTNSLVTNSYTTIPTSGSRIGCIYAGPANPGVLFSQYTLGTETPGSSSIVTINTSTTISNIAYSVSIEDTTNVLSTSGNMIVSGNATIGSLTSSQTISSSSTISGTFINPTDSSNQGTIDQISTELTLFGSSNKVALATNNSLVFKNDNTQQLSAYTGRHKIDPVDIHRFVTSINSVINFTTFTTQSTSMGGNAVVGFATTENKLRMFIAVHIGRLYYTTSSNGSTWTFPPTLTLETTSRAYIGVGLTADGSRAVIPVQNGLIYFCTWNGSNYSALTQTLDNTSRFYQGIGMTSDGSRIIIPVLGGKIFFANWNGTNYNALTQTLDVTTTVGAGCATTTNGSGIVYFNNSSPGRMYYALWNGSNYSAPVDSVSIAGMANNCKFNADGTIIFFTLNNGTNVYYATWNGVVFGPPVAISTSFIPNSGNQWPLDVSRDGSILMNFNYNSSTSFYQTNVSYIFTPSNKILKQTLSLQHASNLILITVGSGGNILSYNLGILRKGTVIRGVFFWIDASRTSGSHFGIYRQSDVTLMASSQSNLAISVGFNYIPLSSPYTIPATDIYYVSTLIGGASGVNGLSLQQHTYYNYGFSATSSKLTANTQFTSQLYSSLPSTLSGATMNTSLYNVFIGIYG